MNLEYYIEAGRINNQRLSRTFSGVIDTSVSPDKPKVLSQNKKLVNANYIAAVTLAFNSRNSQIITIENFIQDLFTLLNKGLIETDQMLRTHEIPKDKDYGFPVETIPSEFQRFCKWYTKTINTKLNSSDTITACALVERTDKVHYFSDSCGRMSRLMSIIISIKNNQPVRLHKNRNNFYGNMGPIPTSKQLFNSEHAKEYIDKYKRLPTHK